MTIDEHRGYVGRCRVSSLRECFRQMEVLSSGKRQYSGAFFFFFQVRHASVTSKRCASKHLAFDRVSGEVVACDVGVDDFVDTADVFCAQAFPQLTDLHNNIRQV